MNKQLMLELEPIITKEERISLALTKLLKTQLNETAAKLGITRSSLIRSALNFYLVEIELNK